LRRRPDVPSWESLLSTAMSQFEESVSAVDRPIAI
jgi:hypothetical protein